MQRCPGVFLLAPLVQVEESYFGKMLIYHVLRKRMAFEEGNLFLSYFRMMVFDEATTLGIIFKDIGKETR